MSLLFSEEAASSRHWAMAYKVLRIIKVWLFPEPRQWPLEKQEWEMWKWKGGVNCKDVPRLFKMKRLSLLWDVQFTQ